MSDHITYPRASIPNHSEAPSYSNQTMHIYYSRPKTSKTPFISRSQRHIDSRVISPTPSTSDKNHSVKSDVAKQLKHSEQNEFQNHI